MARKFTNLAASHDWQSGKIRSLWVGTFGTVAFVVTLASGLSLLKADKTQFKPHYPGIVPACSCEFISNGSLSNTTVALTTR